MPKLKNIFQHELVRYILVGGGAVVIDFAVYMLLITYRVTEPSNAKRISFFCGGAWSFFANKYFTFRTRGVKLSEPLLFAGIYAVGFVLNSILHDLILNTQGVKIVAFTVATFVSVIWNYLGQKYIVFRVKKQIHNQPGHKV